MEHVYVCIYCALFVGVHPVRYALIMYSGLWPPLTLLPKSVGGGPEFGLAGLDPGRLGLHVDIARGIDTCHLYIHHAICKGRYSLQCSLMCLTKAARSSPGW